MDRAEAIKDLQENGIDLGAGDFVDVEALKVAVACMREQEQREQGCEACNNTSTDILAVTVDGYAWLPKWATKFCPMCGRKLGGADHE